MNNLDLLTGITVFVLSVCWSASRPSARSPRPAHPADVGLNSVHGTVVIGAMLIAAESHTSLACAHSSSRRCAWAQRELRGSCATLARACSAPPRPNPLEKPT